jgi:hypothetical protein
LKSGKDFLDSLRELDDDTLSAVAGILVRREREARESGTQFETMCHGLGPLLAQRAMCERGLGFHPDVREFPMRDDGPVNG